MTQTMTFTAEGAGEKPARARGRRMEQSDEQEGGVSLTSREGGPRAGLQGDAPGAKESARHTVMIVEDDPAFIYLVERYVSRKGCRVVSADTGQEALALAQQEQPAVIFLDLTLPGLDGWEVLHTLRADDATCDIPVVICSALDEETRSREEGADGFLRKPVLHRAFLDILAEVGLDLR